MVTSLLATRRARLIVVALEPLLALAGLHVGRLLVELIQSYVPALLMPATMVHLRAGALGAGRFGIRRVWWS